VERQKNKEKSKMDKVNEVFGKLDGWLGPKKGKY